MPKWAEFEIERRWGALAHSHIIGRTERVKTLKRLLQENRIVYLSSFFWSGKTVLLDQLARRLPGKALRFNVGDDDWSAFAASVEAAGDCVLLIDSLQRADHVTEEALAALLANLKEGQRAVLAGRAQLPASLRALSIGGGLEVLGLDFVLFDEEEIRQLFLEYGIVLKGADVTWLKQMGQGWPLLMHIIARRSQQDPGRPVRDMRDVVPELWDMLLRNVLVDFPEPERILLYSLSPFESFSEDMARMVTGRQDAPAMMSDIAQKSYMLLRERDGRYSFIPLVRGALFHEMRNRYTQSYIDGQYKRAALYYELNGRLTEAIEYYMALGETEKIRELLIRDSRLRPSNGEYVELKRAYDMLPAETIEGSPELMKGICMIESLSGRVTQSEYWYERLERYVHSTPARDAQRRTAQEALAYLDIALPHRGAGRMLRTLISTAKLGSFVHSQSWRIGFNVAGNSVSLLNGGKDFSRWVPHGRALYRLFKLPVEHALGRGGSGMADVAIAECELESSLDGDYGAAMNGICRSMTGVSDDLEMRCAAIGIQSRIMMARGDLEEARELMRKHIDALPPDAPKRLRQNLEVYRLTLGLMAGDTTEAMDWLALSAPDEQQDFIILDRYRYMLKLRLYIIKAQWSKTRLLAAQLATYFEQYDRPFMRIQLHLMQAVIDWRQGMEEWRGEMEKALLLGRRYRLVRVIADEGIAVTDMLSEMKLPEDEWTRGVVRLTREQAARHPYYLRSIAETPVLTSREYQVYSLLVAGYSNAEIGKLLNLTERTVKHYLTLIYKKLGVRSRAEALARHAEQGDL